MKRVHYLVFFLFVIFIINVAFDRIKGNPRSAIWCDSEGYYLYLPAIFIIKDFHNLPHGSMWPNYNDKGEFVNKYSCGVAYFELPFFAIGYLISTMKGIDSKDYFSPVYTRSISFGGILITALGLLLLFKSLIRKEYE